MSTLNIRTARASDAAAITRIDTAGLATGHASFRADPYTWPVFAEVYLGENGLALVAERDDQVLGWAGVAKQSDRCVYAGVGEVSCYVAVDAQGQGIGKTLLNALIEHSEARGYWTLTAQIFVDNKASLALHRACGFKVLGRRERIGHMGYGPMAGTWRDTILLEKRSTVVGR